MPVANPANQINVDLNSCLHYTLNIILNSSPQHNLLSINMIW